MNEVIIDPRQLKQQSIDGRVETGTDPKVDTFCNEIIEGAYAGQTPFGDIEALSHRQFLLGTISVFTRTQLENTTISSKTHGTALEHIGAYTLARYLDISKSKPQNERGFYSWPLIHEQGITTDPDVFSGTGEDIICLAHNDDGKILGHLRISHFPEDLAELPLTSSQRTDSQRLEIEAIHGNCLEHPNIEGLNVGNAALLTRFSRVSTVPGIPGILNKLAKGKISTHLVAAAFGHMQGAIQNGSDTQVLLFDGEQYAINNIEVLGLNVDPLPSQLSSGETHVPPILYPRYFYNNRDGVAPFILNLEQLGDPQSVELYTRLENGETGAFLRMVLKQLLMSTVSEKLASRL